MRLVRTSFFLRLESRWRWIASAVREAFDIKAFHDQVLGNGALPLVLLERVIDDWIVETRDAAA